MQAITVIPGALHSARLEERPRPQPGPGDLLVRALALGICGTDHEILAGDYGIPPPGAARLVIGHESLGQVVEAPAGSGFVEGDHVVGIVRRPDPAPCPACAGGEWDMCRNGLYTERGIKALDGYGAELYRLEVAFAVKVDPGLGLLAVLLEPASVLAKAWQHIDHIGGRSRSWSPRTLLVTGAGPVGLLGALMGVQRGLQTHIYDRAEDGPKLRLAADLGAAYHPATSGFPAHLQPDVILECTGAASVVAEVLGRAGPNGVVCLTGLSLGGRRTPVDLGRLNREIVLQNEVVFGSVNANRGHYEAAAQALGRADPSWLGRLLSRHVPLRRWVEAFEQRPDDVKVVIVFDGPAT